MPADWVDIVNKPQTEAELEAVRRAVARNSPFGSDEWSKLTAETLGLQATLRPRGRPRKKRERDEEQAIDPLF
jgi:putative transposase